MKRVLIFMVLCICASVMQAQRSTLKTNLIYDTTSSLNVGAETLLGDHLSFDVSVNINPWTFSGNRKMKHLMVQPELRYWQCTPYNGSFWGVHTHYAKYNFSGMLPWGFSDGRMFGLDNRAIINHRYEGWLAGGGFSYGYHLILSRRLGLEFELGLGYTYLKYDKFPCVKCGRRQKSSHKNFIGPTKAAVSLVYYIK